MNTNGDPTLQWSRLHVFCQVFHIFVHLLHTTWKNLVLILLLSLYNKNLFKSALRWYQKSRWHIFRISFRIHARSSLYTSWRINSLENLIFFHLNPQKPWIHRAIYGKAFQTQNIISRYGRNFILELKFTLFTKINCS